jgi:hypothetical protein
LEAALALSRLRLNWKAEGNRFLSRSGKSKSHFDDGQQRALAWVLELAPVLVLELALALA